MATTKEFAEEVLDALGARDVRVRAVFGEYGCSIALRYSVAPAGGHPAYVYETTFTELVRMTGGSPTDVGENT